LVGLASNFIVGDKVIPLDAKKHTETPSIKGTDPACEKTAGDDYYSLTEFSNPVPNGNM